MPLRFLVRAWPLLLVAAGLAAVLALGIPQALNWDTLSAHLATLRRLVAERPAEMALAYVGLYAALVALAVPGGGLFTVTGGVLFGAWLGTALAVIAASAGAVLLFLAARHALGPLLRRRAARLLDRVRPMLERDGFAGLIAMRLIPVVPFWLSNLAPALLGMRLGPFALATLLGIVPGSAVFASLGAGLGDILAAGGTPDLSAALSPRVLLPLLGLALLALLPIGWRRWRASRAPA